MFYDVRILNKDGSVKKTIPAKKLSEKHWKTFEQMEDGIGLLSTAVKPVPGWVKRKLDLQFPVMYD